MRDKERYNLTQYDTMKSGSIEMKEAELILKQITNYSVLQSPTNGIRDGLEITLDTESYYERFAIDASSRGFRVGRFSMGRLGWVDSEWVDSEWVDSDWVN